MTGLGYDLYTTAFGQPNIAPPALIEALLRQAATEVQGHRFSLRFLIGEWREVVDAWQLASWEDYRGVARLGRKTRIGGKQREILWSIFERVRAGLAERKSVTWPDLFGRATAHVRSSGTSPFDFVVVDEAQDVGVAELRFLASLGETVRTGYSSLAISDNESSNSRFPGGRSASMFAGPIRCASTTARHTRSESRLIGYCHPL